MPGRSPQGRAAPAPRHPKPKTTPRVAAQAPRPTPTPKVTPRRASPKASPRQASPKASLLAAAHQSSLVNVPVQPKVDDLQNEFVMETSGPIGEIQPFRTAFFQNISEVRAKAVDRATSPSKGKAVTSNPASLAELRGYETEDLYAIAEIGYHYLFNGGLRLAKVIYEGLTAIAPKEAYFALGLGLTLDLGGERDAAFQWYRKAAFLDPKEPRADLNQAELYLEAKDFRRARRLLQSAMQKAQAAGEQALHTKASALLKHVERIG